MQNRSPDTFRRLGLVGVKNAGNEPRSSGSITHWSAAGHRVYRSEEMTVDRCSPCEQELPLTSEETGLHRELIEQLYDLSVTQYGNESEQALVSLRLLNTDAA